MGEQIDVVELIAILEKTDPQDIDFKQVLLDLCYYVNSQSTGMILLNKKIQRIETILNKLAHSINE